MRYTSSAALLKDLPASLADQTLPQRLHHDGRFDLLIIDEFGFDKIERTECNQGAMPSCQVAPAPSVTGPVLAGVSPVI